MGNFDDSFAAVDGSGSGGGCDGGGCDGGGSADTASGEGPWIEVRRGPPVGIGPATAIDPMPPISGGVAPDTGSNGLAGWCVITLLPCGELE